MNDRAWDVQLKTLSKISICLLLFTIVSPVGCSKRDSVTSIEADDPKMNAAIAKARETLPQFWSKFDHPQPGEDNFCLKVKITDGKEVEHFWVENLRKKDGETFGSIANDPELVHNVKLGDRIEIPEPDITDWFYMRDNKMVGNYTMRVLFDHMSPSEVAKYKALLADP